MSRPKTFSLVACLLAIPLATVPAAQAQDRNGVAVLNDGRVYQGTVQEVPGGYRIQHAGGSTILPFDQISVTSVTLVGAYEAFRDNIRTPDADAHLRLAEWCLSNGLYAQAEMEVQTALRLEPTRSDARLLLKQIDMILHPEKTNQSQQVRQTAPMQAQKSAMNASAFTSVAPSQSSGMSRENQLAYMRKIQPLLMNKCGNAHCHGGQDDNKLFLKIARYDSPNLKSASAHNLDVLYQFIDFENPERSPLLVQPSINSPHHKNLFFGARNEAQYEIIDQWVRSVVAERAGRSAPAMASTPSSPVKMSPIQQTSASVVVTSEEPQKLQHTASASPLPAGQQKSAGTVQADHQFLDQIRQSSRKDNFDPDEFNRMMQSPPK